MTSISTPSSLLAPNFSRIRSVSAVEPCPCNPCCNEKESDDALVAAVSDRTKKLISEDMVTTGMQPGDFGQQFRPGNWSACQNRAADMGAVVRRFDRYSEALPYARAAMDVNELKDEPGSKSKGKHCLTRLPDSADVLNKQLNLKPPLTDKDLRNDKTGFRGALYRSETDGTLILVPRDTEKNSLVDWKTNTDNGLGKFTDQYQAMRNLTAKLQASGVPFNIAGYSKGGGMAQEGGLINTDAKVYVFNGAGIPDKSEGRTAPTTLDNLADRTYAYSADGDFLTYMNQTTDHSLQIANAKYLRDRLAEESDPDNWLSDKRHPMAIDYTNPQAKAAIEARDKAREAYFTFVNAGMPPPPALVEEATKDPDPGFADAKDKYLKDLDKLIEQAGKDPGIRLFPPVRSSHMETVRDSMTTTGRWLGATKPEANLGRLNQHLMENVLNPMEKSVDEDRKAMKQFLEQCG